mmetsp:Transcript_19378/g.27274  ORF Transcript_19378/g.27274 Transcript_19378/m.27274 type:complete len:97 (+) Transcript_19378:1028-1318(+)
MMLGWKSEKKRERRSSKRCRTMSKRLLRQTRSQSEGEKSSATELFKSFVDLMERINKLGHLNGTLARRFQTGVFQPVGSPFQRPGRFEPLFECRQL